MAAGAQEAAAPASWVPPSGGPDSFPPVAASRVLSYRGGSCGIARSSPPWPHPAASVATRTSQRMKGALRALIFTPLRRRNATLPRREPRSCAALRAIRPRPDRRGRAGARSAAFAVGLGRGDHRHDRLARQRMALERKAQTDLRRYPLDVEVHLKAPRDRRAATSPASAAIAYDGGHEVYGRERQRDRGAGSAVPLKSVRRWKIGQVHRALDGCAVECQRER